MSESFYSSQEADNIRQHLRDYVQNNCDKARHPKKGEPYACPFCNSGAHDTADSDSAFHVYSDQRIPKFKCSSCGKSGDIFDLIEKIEGLTGGDVIKRARELYGTTDINYIKAKSKPRQEPKKDNITADTFGNECPFDDVSWDIPQISPLEAENNDSYINTPISDKNAEMDQIQSVGDAVSGGTNSGTAEHAAEPQKIENYKTYLINCHKHVNETDYFKNRGFSDEIINRFSLGYDAYHNSVTIPYDSTGNYYVARYVYIKDKADEIKYNRKRFWKVPKSEPIFNPAGLYNGKPIFVCESQIDALSIIQAGGNAIAIGGTGGQEKLFKAIKARKPANTLIVTMDPDNAGATAFNELSEALTAANINYIKAQFSYDKYLKPVKDANDMLQVNADLLAQDVRQNNRKAWTKEPFRACNIKDYLNNGAYKTDINYFKNYKNRKTGFENIDKNLTLYPGLAALGGSASLGKTTFAVNLCDNLTAAGETVLYFALEQEPIELVTKILARKLYEADNNTKLTNFDIKNGATCDTLERVKAEYASKAERFNIIRCNFTTTAEDIKKYVVNYIEATNTRPIVVIDYLQLVSPPAEFKGDIRTATDHVIKVLKTLQVENDLFVLMISNFNRGAYNTSVSYESFKETGMIEFTCDYVWGLELAVMEHDSFYIKDGGKKKTEQQDRNLLIYEENRKNPKNVCFVSLKSRNGKQCYKCFFKYQMQYDVFIPDYNSPYDKDREPQFEQATAADKVPFEQENLKDLIKAI